MVNKLILNGLQYKVALLLFFISLSQVDAKDFKKYYKSQIKEGSTLYYIPSNISFSSKTTDNHLSYDITYRTDWDSVIINVSFFTKTIYDIDSIRFRNSTTEINTKTHKFFVEKEKKYWHNRYSVSIEKNIYNLLFLSNEKISINPCKLNFCDTLIINQKNWNLHMYINQHVNDLIELNKSK
jgi:hypothetical protein